MIVPLAVAATAVMVLAALLLLGWRLRPQPAAEVRLDINIPQTSAPASIAISPDGRTIAFVATSEGQSRLWIRPLDAGAASPLRGTDGASYPFWSPDSRSIAFFADRSLRRIDLEGEAIRTLTKVFRGTGGSWNADGIIVFSSLGRPIERVAATGGEPTEIAGLVQRGSIFTPSFLPDGKRFLYFVRAKPEARGIYMGHLDGTSDPHRVMEADAGGVYAATGHLLSSDATRCSRSLLRQRLRKRRERPKQSRKRWRTVPASRCPRPALLCIGPPDDPAPANLYGSSIGKKLSTLGGRSRSDVHTVPLDRW